MEYVHALFTDHAKIWEKKQKQNKGKKEETNHPICGYTICHIN